MQVYLLHTDVRIRPPDPVDLVAAVDGKTLRVAIEWSALEHYLGAQRADEASVRELLHRNRHGIELAIKAHLFAYGIPLARHLVLSQRDLGLPGVMHAGRAVPGDDAAARA